MTKGMFIVLLVWQSCVPIVLAAVKNLLGWAVVFWSLQKSYPTYQDLHANETLTEIEFALKHDSNRIHCLRRPSEMHIWVKRSSSRSANYDRGCQRGSHAGLMQWSIRLGYDPWNPHIGVPDWPSRERERLSRMESRHELVLDSS